MRDGFVWMGFNPPVKWMTLKEINDLPFVASFRYREHTAFVDFNMESDTWWYGERTSETTTKWYRIIVVKPHGV